MDARARLKSSMSGAAGFFCLLASMAVAAIPGVGEFTAITLSALCTSAALLLFGYAGALLLSAGVARGLGLGPGRLSWKTGAAAVVGILGLSQLLDGLMRLSGLHAGSALQRLEVLLAGLEGFELGAALLALALAPALGEELFFRGLLLRGMVGRWGTPMALLVSSALFGLLHLDLAHGLAAFALGLFLGAVALVSGSTRLPIVCHGINNAVAVAIAAGGADGGEPWMLALGGVAFGLGLWGVVVRRFPSGSGTPPARN